jgi:predicted amidohydrolase YtcJ
MLADFVELADDIFETPPAEIAGLAVWSTWVGGRCVSGPPAKGA